MDLTFTPAQQAWRAGARAWIADNLPEAWRDGAFIGPEDEDEGVRQQRDWERRLHAAGYAGVAWPRAYGGQGLSVVEQLIINEELGRVAAPEGVNTVGMELVGPILLAAGTERQRRELIPRILSVETIWCQGFSEPEAGSDLASLRTSAVRDGGHWVINGQKLWTTYARYADLCLLLARTDPAAPKHRGLGRPHFDHVPERASQVSAGQQVTSGARAGGDDHASGDRVCSECRSAYRPGRRLRCLLRRK